jgi:hypothetical protein
MWSDSDLEGSTMADQVRDLLAPDVIRHLRVLVVSEGFGVQLFGVAERLARTHRQKQIWGALHELEAQTRVAVLEKLGEDVERFVAGDKLARAVGTASGPGLGLLPHGLQMRALIAGTRPFMPHFERLAHRFAGTPRAAFFDYVLAHERAIVDVGRRCLARDDDELSAVEKLLGAVPN